MANNNNNVKTFGTDIPNISKSFSAGSGTIILVPRAEESNTVKELVDRLNDGRIDVSNIGVLTAPAAKILLRLVVDDAVQQALPANGHRPTQIQVTMTDSVAALATNVKTVRRFQCTLRTIGGVENEKQYTAGMNELLRTLGAPAYHSLHHVMAALHVFATNYHKAAVVSTAASTALTTRLKEFRDHLCSRFGPPQSVQDQLQAKNATIKELKARLQGMKDFREAETNRNLVSPRGKKRERPADDKESSADEEE